LPHSNRDLVFVVDDEEMVCLALENFLQLETAYDIRTFTAPHDALHALDSEAPGVIIADFMMPGLDGISFLRRCRDIHPLATRILLTGYADKENAIRAINEAGLYYYLEKPWDNDHLKLIVRNGMERSSLFNELDSRVSALEHANKELYDIRRRLIQAFV
jgi:putative two-component system response regulator